MANEPTSELMVDPLLARLERLAQRRGTPQPPPPPPPPAGPVRGSALTGPPLIEPTRPPTPRATQPMAAKPRRRHPARGARMGALAVSCATTAGLAYLFADLNANRAASAALSALPAPVATTPGSTAATSHDTPNAPATSAPTTQKTTSGASTASTSSPQPSASVTAFNGEVVNTRYGPVQVQVQISDGRLVEVAVVRYPDGDGRSVRINARALPRLRSEALSAQSASVDTVSGATYTSQGYARSLQSAIDEARAAGVTTLA